MKILLALLLLLLTSVTPVRAQGSLVLAPESKNFTLTVNLEEEFSLKVLIDTFGQSAGGGGVKLNFDPARLKALEIIPGSIFGDYPGAVIDNAKGKITISGLASSTNNMFSGQGIFATIKWKSLKPGNTEITFDFQPGSTTDSNIAVTFGNGDILTQVNTAKINVLKKRNFMSSNAVNSGAESIISELDGEILNLWPLVIIVAVISTVIYLATKKKKKIPKTKSKRK